MERKLQRKKSYCCNDYRGLEGIMVRSRVHLLSMRAFVFQDSCEKNKGGC